MKTETACHDPTNIYLKWQMYVFGFCLLKFFIFNNLWLSWKTFSKIQRECGFSNHHTKPIKHALKMGNNWVALPNRIGGNWVALPNRVEGKWITLSNGIEDNEIALPSRIEDNGITTPSRIEDSHAALPEGMCANQMSFCFYKNCKVKSTSYLHMWSINMQYDEMDGHSHPTVARNIE